MTIYMMQDKIDSLIAEKEVMSKHIQIVQMTWDGCDSDRTALRAEIRRLEEALDSNVLLQQIRAQEAEIEKLKDEAIHNEGVMVALKEGYLERGVDIDRLKTALSDTLNFRRELINSYFANDHKFPHLIAHKMIDAAVEYAETWQNSGHAQWIWSALGMLNIYQCEHLKATQLNDVLVGHCSDCNGHGWIIKK